MQPILIVLSVLALIAPNARVAKTSVNDLLMQTGDSSFASRGKQAEIANIEAYIRMLDRYFKRHPKSTCYYVDALPEGKADESSGSKKEWYAVKNETEMLDAERGYANGSIFVLAKDGEIVHAGIGEPAEHSRRENDYYFRADGTLAKILSDYYGTIEEIHIVRESFYDTGGRLLRSTTRCFNVITTSRGSREQPASCKKSEMRRELSDYKLSVYAKSTDLPGYDIIKRR